jgi:hypothetical protein
MAGALIVEGDFDDIVEIAAATERVLILNEVLFDYRGTIETYDTVWPEASPRFLSVNGQREPVIRMRPGEVQRWRIVHAGHEENLHVALEGHLLHAIAYDGIRRSMIDRRESLLLAPGQRATYWLRPDRLALTHSRLLPTTRVMLRRLARLHGLWSKASRCRCGFPPRLEQRLSRRSVTRKSPTSVALRYRPSNPNFPLQPITRSSRF